MKEKSPLQIYEMAFSESIIQRELAHTFNCSICDLPLTGGMPIEVHSISGLHLVMTDTASKEHRNLIGKTRFLAGIPEDEEFLSDGVPLCLPCHQEINRIALEEAKLRNPGFRGQAPPTQILAEVTIFFMERHKPLSFEVVR